MDIPKEAKNMRQNNFKFGGGTVASGVNSLHEDWAMLYARNTMGDNDVREHAT